MFTRWNLNIFLVIIQRHISLKKYQNLRYNFWTFFSFLTPKTANFNS